MSRSASERRPASFGLPLGEDAERQLGEVRQRLKGVGERFKSLPFVNTRRPGWWAFGFYVALSLITMGWRILPHPATACACQGNDPPTYVWALAWWPYAVLHGINPFVTHFVWYPVGANVTRFATIPSVAFVLWPITALFGPLVSYNFQTLASPVLAAFSAYLLCRRLCGRQLPAVVGGYLFGFGAYQFPQLVGHPNLAIVFLIPLMVLLALKRVGREVSGRFYVLAMAAMIVFQLGISTEVLTTAIVLGLVMILAGFAFAPHPYRERMDSLLLETVGAGWLAALIASPFLYYALVKGGSPQSLAVFSDAYALDLLNPFFPTLTTWLGGGAFHPLTQLFEGGDFAEANGYLALPIILAFVLWAVRTRRRSLKRMLLVAVTVSLVLALGSHLHVAGVETVALPYKLIRNLPLANQITPSRIAMYTSLAVAVGVAAWLAEDVADSRRRLARWLLVGLGCVMVFPSLGGELWSAPPSPPAFFRTAMYRRYIKPGETLLALPFGYLGTTMGWQAECGFCFRMPGGYLGHFAPPQIANQKIVEELAGNHPADPARLGAFLTRYGIRDIVVDASLRTPSPYALQLTQLGFHPIVVGGVFLFHVGPDGQPVGSVSRPAPRAAGANA